MIFNYKMDHRSLGSSCGRERLGLLTFMLSGTRILRAFLIIGWGLSSSSLKECLLGSKLGWLLDIAMSEGSMSNIPIPSGPLPVGVSRGGQEDEEEEEGDSQDSFILDWLPGITRKSKTFQMFLTDLLLNWHWFYSLIHGGADGSRPLWR